MSSLDKKSSLRDYQDFIKAVYSLPNDRQYSAWDMIANIERFIMRGLKGIRKEDKRKTKRNLLIALSWLFSLMNRLHIDMQVEVHERFPYCCSYCLTLPCSCKKIKMRRKKSKNIKKQKLPQTLQEFQQMFEKIYPAEKRAVEHAGIHLAEEMGELSEAFLIYRSGRTEKDFKEVRIESADLFSCLISVFNSLNIDISKELSEMFYDSCHVCHKEPCGCSFNNIVKFKS